MVEIIAEIGINHNGNYKEALKLIDAAKAAGADTVKFQIYNVETLLTFDAPKVTYQKHNDLNKRSHFEMLHDCQLSLIEQEGLFKYCNDIGIGYLNTPYDIESLKFLVSLGIKRVKVASADLIDLVLLNAIAKHDLEVILSIGIASIEEIKMALRYLGGSYNKTTLLHCVSNYPCSDASLNLNVIQALREKFSLPVGFSDHSLGNHAAITSVALGACMIEKHFTLDKNLAGPDHVASSDPEEFSNLVRDVRRTQTQLGSAEKRVQPEEQSMKTTSRKSAYASKDLIVGGTLTFEDIKMLRPGNGINGLELHKVLGAKIKNKVKADQIIKLNDFE